MPVACSTLVRLHGAGASEVVVERRAQPHRRIVFVCTNQREPGDRVCCADRGGAALREHLKDLVKRRGLRGRIRISQSGCLDRCEDGPNIMVFPDNVWYSSVQLEDLPAILDDLIASLRAEGMLPRGYDDAVPEGSRPTA